MVCGLLRMNNELFGDLKISEARNEWSSKFQEEIS